MVKQRLLLAFLFCVPLLLHGVQAEAQQTTRGKDFYLTFLPNFHLQTPFIPDSLYIYVVAEVPTKGSITYRNGGGTVTIINFNITNPQQIYQYGVPYYNLELYGYNQGGALVTNNDNETVSPRHFRIQAENDVAVYALNQAEKTSDATLVLPITALGNEYYVMAYKSDGVLVNNTVSGSYTPSQFVVVATEDNTDVTVETTAPTTETGLQAKRFTLNRGQSYLFQAEFSRTNLNYDLTGSRVRSNRPVAVFGGHQRATIPVELRGQLTSRDHLFEQMMPLSVWGKSYIVTPFAQPRSAISLGDDLFRVVASEDNTTVLFNGRAITTLNRGAVYESPLTTAGLLTANKKVMVALFKQTSTIVSDGQPPRIGDPFMMIIPPRRQYLNKYRFQNCQVVDTYEEQYITIVTTKNNIPTLRLDGNPVQAQFLDVPTTCFVYANVRMQDGAHTLESDKLVGLYAYGFGEANSYGYVGGMAFLPDVEDVFVDAGPDQIICVAPSDTATLTVRGNASTVKWTSLGTDKILCDTCLSIKVKPGVTTKYKLAAIDSLGCEVNDEVVVNVYDRPTLDATPDTVICTDVSVLLRANGTFLNIQWSPPEGLTCPNCPTTYATPNRDITYYAIASNSPSPDCQVKDSVKIHFQQGINGQLPPTIALCSGDSVNLKLNYGGKVRWTPATGISCATCTDVVIKATANIRYIITGDSANCTTRDTIDIRIVNKPKLTVPPDTAICMGQSITLVVQSDGTLIEWTPSPRTSSTPPCSDCKILTITPEQTVKYVVRANPSSSCGVVDSFTVTVNPLPFVSPSPRDTAFCKGGSVSLHANATDTDSFEWSPAQGLSCTTCPDPIAQPDKTTTYTLKARTAKGCEVLVPVRVTVYDPPTLAIARKTGEVCKGQSFDLKVASNATVVWSPAIGLSCTDCLDPVAQPDVTTTYIVRARSAEGCETVDSALIRVNPLPSFSLQDTVQICLKKDAILDMKGAQPDWRYTWSPPEGLSCVNCSSPVASPDVSTLYRITVLNSAGCTTIDSVQVEITPCERILSAPDINVGAMLACSQKTIPLVLENKGQSDLIVYEITPENNANVRMEFVTPRSATPDTLAYGSPPKNIDATIIPLRTGPFEIRVAMRTNTQSLNSTAKDTIQYLTARGVAEERPVYAGVTGGTVNAGEFVQIPISVGSAFLGELNLDTIDLKVSYGRDYMTFAKKIGKGSALGDTAAWDVRYESFEDSDPAYTIFKLRGKKPLAEDGIVLVPEFQTLLSRVDKFSADVAISFPGKTVDCIAENTTAAEVNLGGCVLNIRKVNIGGAFGLLNITPNPANSAAVTVEYGVGFACDADVAIVDELGREVLVLAKGYHQGGVYQAMVPLERLSSGMYYCRYHASSVHEVKQLMIMK